MGDRENAEGEVAVVGEVSEAHAMYEHSLTHAAYVNITGTSDKHARLIGVGVRRAKEKVPRKQAGGI